MEFTLQKFTNYLKAVQYVVHEIPKTSRQVFDEDSTLQKNAQIMELLGNPQNRHPAVHVAGTSGKGTICYLVDAVLRAHSKRTGMTQSPHVYDIRERTQINGQLMSERQFVQALNTVMARTASSGIRISYFEILTAMGFATLAKSIIDYQIIETGFGGRLDATNVMSEPSKVCVLGQIGLDHTETLGDTLDKIAGEKAGIVQPYNTVIALRQDDSVNAVFEKRCEQQHAELIWVEQGQDYQLTNDELALTACRVLSERDGWQFDESQAAAALQQVFIPGRYEKRRFQDHLAILDGAHNPQKLTALADRVVREDKAPVTVVLSLGDRKDVTACLTALKPITKRVIATEYFTKEQDIPKRPIPVGELVTACKLLGIEAEAIRSPEEALNLAALSQEPILITGSFYLLGELDKLF